MHALNLSKFVLGSTIILLDYNVRDGVVPMSELSIALG